ncbi:MAG: type IV secretory system conjugative DNA transfer family protein, partial [Oscillospiraceae bacterium]
MSQTQILLLCLCGVFFVVIAVLAAIGNLYSLRGIPNKPVGNGQHGMARFATNSEVTRTYKQIPYTPQLWRNGQKLPNVDGLIIGCQKSASGMTALVDDA